MDVADFTVAEQKLFSGYQIQLAKWTIAEDVAHATLPAWSQTQSICESTHPTQL